MFQQLCDELVIKIMEYGDIKTLKMYKYINRDTQIIYKRNEERILKNMMVKKCKIKETNSSFNFQMKKHTVSVTKYGENPLFRAMYLSGLF
tara:strand:- start:7 stop:279 length:273 start_codon:yes stop_codon:yes gene_type:complete